MDRKKFLKNLGLVDVDKADSAVAFGVFAGSSGRVLVRVRPAPYLPGPDRVIEALSIWAREKWDDFIIVPLSEKQIKRMIRKTRDTLNKASWRPDAVFDAARELGVVFSLTDF